MTERSSGNHRPVLLEIARTAMTERDLAPDFSDDVIRELEEIKGPASETGGKIADLRNLPWCSIDNNDSRDLDQLTVAEPLPDGTVKIRVAVADVDALVVRRSAIDNHARQNTTSIYTAGGIFPMLPDKLSTDLTSLNYKTDRLAIVMEMVIDNDGYLTKWNILRAMVHNHAKLAYNSLGAWLEGQSSMPEGIREVEGLEDNLLLQNEVAQKLNTWRFDRGALEFTTIEARAVFEGDMLVGLETDEKNKAREIIEDFMITANTVTTRFLTSVGFPSFRRIVRVPKRWNRIREIAAEKGHTLPEDPDSKALQEFLSFSKKADPEQFPDLSLSIIKLLGQGEYDVEFPGDKPVGHFGLALRDYSHSTAPNRRYPDLITHRLIKAAMRQEHLPYSQEELEQLALHCTLMEDAAKKVERQVAKSAAALLLENRIGETFRAIVTGAADKGTWVRLMEIPVEGRLVEGFHGVDVGYRIKVRLESVDVDRGYIDFVRD